MDSLFFYILDLPKSVNLDVVKNLIKINLNVDDDPVVRINRLSDYGTYVELTRETDVETFVQTGKIFIIDRPYVIICDQVYQTLGDYYHVLTKPVIETFKKRCKSVGINFDNFLNKFHITSTEQADGSLKISVCDVKGFYAAAKRLLLFNESDESGSIGFGNANARALRPSLFYKLVTATPAPAAPVQPGGGIGFGGGTGFGGGVAVGGDQPDGGHCHLKTCYDLAIAGYPNSTGYIEIEYHVPSGIQGPRHPNPGQAYSGTTREAYLPNTDRGKRVARMLQVAFRKGLIFTVGTSATTNLSNTIVWAGKIPHKTSFTGGPQNYGYPDPHYLDDVEASLKNFGIDQYTV